MSDKKLSTDPYKGVRDFYPEDMAVQQYIFNTWAYTAESFGFERYDASVLEPAELYKAKGAENEEMVNEQTYTFTDRGGREVTLRPEMTPTVARMIAKKQKELAFPVRWYSIPNLFRYERTQRGRLREHWQLNCDIFGSDAVAADIEIIALAYQIFINFGADPTMFEIRVNDRSVMNKAYAELGIDSKDIITAITRLNDQKDKISADEYISRLIAIVGDEGMAGKVQKLVESGEAGDNAVVAGLRELGIENIRLDRSLARGFDYYTGTVFEFFDTDPSNNRALLGGGRYDNLTALFGGDAVPGVGFGFGDVTMRNFLETHNLLTADIPSATLVIIPTSPTLNIEAQKIAQQFRSADITTAVDISSKKIAKKLSSAADSFVTYALVLGEDEIASGNFVLKNLATSTEKSGTVNDLIQTIVK